MIQIGGLRDTGKLYAGDDLRNPLAAPLYGDFKGLPALLVQVGTHEVLLDDATRVADKARAAGVGPHLPEAADAVRRIGEFVRERIPD